MRRYLSAFFMLWLAGCATGHAWRLSADEAGGIVAHDFSDSYDQEKALNELNAQVHCSPFKFVSENRRDVSTSGSYPMYTASGTYQVPYTATKSWIEMRYVCLGSKPR